MWLCLWLTSTASNQIWCNVLSLLICSQGLSKPVQSWGICEKLGISTQLLKKISNGSKPHIPRHLPRRPTIGIMIELMSVAKSQAKASKPYWPATMRKWLSYLFPNITVCLDRRLLKKYTQSTQPTSKQPPKLQDVELTKYLKQPYNRICSKRPIRRHGECCIDLHNYN